jgi:hypothetical protein
MLRGHNNAAAPSMSKSFMESPVEDGTSERATSRYSEYWQAPHQKCVKTPRVGIKILSRERALA